MTPRWQEPQTGALAELRNMGRWLHNQMVRFRYLSPRQVLADYRRAARLAQGRVAMAQPVSPGPERLVVSLTTIPARLADLRPTLLSLMEQTRPPDRLILALPNHSCRDGRPYTLPEALAADLSGGLPRPVSVLRCRDWGPATKLLPALRAEPGALVVAVDDDVIYPRDHLETLLAAHRERPRAALGWRGWRIQPGVPPRRFAHVWASAVTMPQPADILLGWGGYLIPPGALDAAVFDYAGWPEAMRWVDDVWISGHLARRGVARLVVPGRSYPVARAISWRAGLSDGINRSDEHNRVAIAAMGAFWGGTARGEAPDD